MQLQDIVKRNWRAGPWLPPEAPLEEALCTMLGEKVSSVLIRGKNGISGIVTRSDILNSLASSQISAIGRELPLSQVMSPKLIVAAPGTSLRQALAQMNVAGIEHLPVIDNGTHLGTLHLKDLLQHHNTVLQNEIVHLQEYIATLQEADND